MKKTIVLTSALAACLLFSGCSSEETVSKQQYDEVVTQNQDLEQQVSDLNTQIDEIKQQTLIPQLKEEAAAVTKAISSIGEVTLEKEKTISSVEQQYNALREDAKQYVTNYDILTTAKERISQLRASQTDAEKAQEYKSSCTAGYSYTELARDPNTYVGKNAKFTGKVIQVSEGLGSTVMRVDVTQGKYSWDDTLYVTYTPKDGESRILEDDIITIYGEMQPLKTYTTVMGASVSIPAIDAKYIEIG